MNRRIFKTGHSLAITLSKKILENLGAQEGDEVEVLAENGRVMIKKSQKNTQLAMPFSSRPKLGGARHSK
jgi:antitoxin component of MazEF toxin-antitoxin module